MAHAPADNGEAAAAQGSEQRSVANSATRIIATLGPSTDSLPAILELIGAGMTVARINYSHGTHEEHARMIELVKQARRITKQYVAIAMDTRGPELRVKTRGRLDIKAGQKVIFVDESQLQQHAHTPDTHYAACGALSILDGLGENDVLVLDDCKLRLRVTGASGESGLHLEVATVALNSHALETNKRLSCDRPVANTSFLQHSDAADLKHAVECGIDMVFASFVECAANVGSIRSLVGDPSVQIVAKIETQRGIDNVGGIAAAADGVMIARGDLCTAVGVERMFSAQKYLAGACAGKPVVMATEMMLSMVGSDYPTRAEISDVGNAVCDGCSGVMLSSESAVGSAPALCVRTMRDVCRDAEAHMRRTGQSGPLCCDAVSHKLRVERTELGCIVFCSSVHEARPLSLIKGLHIILEE
ncbi:pyruvate kinase [Pancytospora philotis]|nr:pyruvate kinase [Pancytospora philotis]